MKTFSLIIFLFSFSISILAQKVGPARYQAILDEEAERDARSSVGTWPYVFPIWGQKATNKGYKLPIPYGLSAQYYYSSQSLFVPKVIVGLNDGQNYDVSSLVAIGDIPAKVGAATVRPNIWLFPFLNVYAIIGNASGTTEVPMEAITLPDRRIEIGKTAIVNNAGMSYGVGATFNAKIGSMFTIVDVSHTWTKMERFEEPFPAAVAGIRVGKRFELNNGSHLAVWGGAMGQFLSAETVGRILVNDLAPNLEAKAAELTSARDANCNQIGGVWVPKVGSGYTAVQCNAVAALAAVANGAAGSSINYNIDKKLKAVWNVLIGANYDINRNWALRAEVGLFSRYSAMLGFEYKFGSY